MGNTLLHPKFNQSTRDTNVEHISKIFSELPWQFQHGSVPLERSGKNEIDGMEAFMDQ